MSMILSKLQDKLGSHIVVEPEQCANYTRDTWVLSELRDFEGSPPPRPRAVVEAESVEDISLALQTCYELGIPVVPFGGGSGVCGGIISSADCIVISTQKLTGLVSLSKDNLSATFLAGTNGMEAERLVAEQGFTIGHWPQSIELSTVGGWVATRASGQYSTGYGNIEDILLGLEAILPQGEILRSKLTPRASAGPDLRQLFLGSEGTLGLISEVTLALRPKPETSQGQAFCFETLTDGMETIRRIIHAGWAPPVVRLYDASESHRHFHETTPEGSNVLVLLHEGTKEQVEMEQASVSSLCAEAGERCDEKTVSHWLERRNHVPHFREFIEKGIIVDTIEVACGWDRIIPLYETVTQSLREIPSMLLATGHSSHSYRSGTNLYFTFVARPKDSNDLAAVYQEAWKRTMETTAAIGGGIAHHHGIGRVRRNFLEAEIGATGVQMLRTIKKALDPKGLLNPGVLLPEE